MLALLTLCFCSCDAYLLRSYYNASPNQEEESDSTEDLSDLVHYGDFYLKLDDKGYAVHSYMGRSPDVVIPSEVEGINIYKIAEKAFVANTLIKSVTLPDTVNRIDGNAFADCIALSWVKLGAGLSYIGPSAFVGCTSLVSVEGASVTTVASYAFSGCTALNELSLPTVQTIGEEAFDSCSSLSAIYFEKLVSMGKSAFSDCISLSSVTLSDGFTAIPQEAFSGCTALNELILPEGLTSIGRGAFSGCASLGTIDFPTTLTKIDTSAFYKCTSLSALTLPESVTEIGDRAFFGCTSLKELTFPEGLKVIPSSAFAECVSLKDIELPKRLSEIGVSAFAGCYSIEEINMPDSLRTIGNNAFSGCEKLSKAEIPSGVSSLGDGAFKNCSSITEMTIPEFVTSIPDYLFYGCKELSKVTLWADVVMKEENREPNKYIEYIGTKAFYGCESLNKINIPESVTIIGREAFAYCPYIFGLSMPSGNLKVGAEILKGSEETLIGFDHDEDMVNRYDAGEKVDLDAYSNNSLWRMVFYFDYRVYYRFVRKNMCSDLINAMPDVCPGCGSSKIKAQTSLRELAFKLNEASGPFDEHFVCDGCGGGFDHRLSK